MSAVIGDRVRWRDAREALQADAVTRFSMDVCLRRYAKVLSRAAAGERLLSVSTGL
jgi:hypothetical protein